MHELDAFHVEDLEPERAERVRLLRELLGHDEPVATKSRGRRDRQGRRLNKPHGLDQGEYEEPRRDGGGRRLNKPHDPNSPRNRRR
jgi:hypothetical protein